MWLKSILGNKAELPRTRQDLELLEYVRREYVAFVVCTLISVPVGLLAIWLGVTETIQSMHFGWFFSWGLRIAGLLGVVYPIVAWSGCRRAVREHETALTERMEAARQARDTVCMALRKLYFEQTEYLLLTGKSEADQKRWADQPGRFKEIIEEWPKAKERFDEIRSRSDYPILKSELEGKAEELEAMWEKREKLLRYARFESEKPERIRTDQEKQYRIRKQQAELRRQIEELDRELGGEEE